MTILYATGLALVWAFLLVLAMKGGLHGMISYAALVVVAQLEDFDWNELRHL